MNVKFTSKEIEHLEGSPKAICIVADHHDLQESMSDAMGAPSKVHKSRRIELNKAADELQAKFEGEDS